MQLLEMVDARQFMIDFDERQMPKSNLLDYALLWKYKTAAN